MYNSYAKFSLYQTLFYFTFLFRQSSKSISITINTLSGGGNIKYWFSLSFNVLTTLWLVMFLLSFLIEIKIRQLYFLNFLFASFITAIFSMLHSDAIFQLFIFVILFVVIRIVIHPILVKRKTYRIFINQICTFIGREAVVTKTITCNEYGIINFAGISWNAITKEEELKEGEVVLITNKFETFLVVSKINTA